VALGAAAAAVIVAVIAAGDDRDETVPSEAASYLFPSVPPLGLDVVVGTVDLEEAAVDAVQVDGEVLIYAETAGMGSPSVAVLTIADPGGTNEPPDGRAVVVQGADATISPDRLFQPGVDGDLTVAWRRPGEVAAVVTSGLTEAEALEVAEGARFEGAGPSLVDGVVPDGMAPQHRDRFAAVAPAVGSYELAGDGASVVGFGDAAGEDPRVMLLSAGPGDQRRLDAVRPFLFGPNDVEVRGTIGISGSPYEGAVTLTWLEGDRTVVRLLGLAGVTTDDLFVVAESLEPISKTAFDEMLESVAPSVLPRAPSPAEAALRLDRDDGVFWVEIDEDSDSIDVVLLSGGTIDGMSTRFREVTSEQALVGLLHDTTFAGVVGPDVARAVVIDGDTSTEAELIDVPEYPLKAFILTVSGRALLETYDADGNLLQSVN
jgi:hypothetical protein